MPARGSLTEDIDQGNGQTDHIPVKYFVGKADYVVGGVTFNFLGLFTATPGNGPWATVGLQLKNILPATMVSLTAEITELDGDHIKVKVLKNDLLTIVEALADDVTIHVRVWGRPA